MTRFVAVLVALLIALLPTARAAAHEGGGTISIAARTPAGGGAVGFEVAAAFVDDGHPASEATVTAVVEQDGAPSSTPVLMAPTGAPGHYAGQVRFPSPGRWTVRFTSVSPVGTLEASEVVESGPAPAAPAVPVARPADARAPLGPRDGGAGNTGLLGLLLGLLGVGAIALLMVRSSRRARPASPGREELRRSDVL